MDFLTIMKYLLIAVIVIYAIALPINAYIKTKKIFSKGVKKHSNYHTHTTFCDGENSPEEMVLAAIDAGLPELGFSGHSHLEGEPDWTMSVEGTKEYGETVLALKEKYKDKINIRLGIEQDYWSDTDGLSDYEYVIGAVHSLNGDDTTWSSVDYKIENFERCIELYCDGDKMTAVEKYFELVGNLYEKTHCRIIAHFDTVTKFNKQFEAETGKPYIDTEDERYIAAEKKALEKLTDKPVIFEINTGGMARGICDKPYPSERVLKYLSEKRTPVILSSDAHSRDAITYGFDKASELVLKYDLNLVTVLD